MELTFGFDETPTGGRFTASDAQGHVAELAFSKTSDTLVIADHTNVPEAFRGQGVGVALAERFIEYLRAHGKKVFPLCPFVMAQMQKHPEWHDVLSR